MAPQNEPEPEPAPAGLDVVSYGRRQLDRVLSPATRESAYDATMTFASERPIFFLFLASQLFFSLLPLVLFVSFAACVALFALAAAVLFTLFWVAVGALFLVPTLFFTGSIALMVWLWVVAAFLTLRWLYNLLPEPEPEPENGAPRPPQPPRGRQQDALRTGPTGQGTHGTGASAVGPTQHQEPMGQMTHGIGASAVGSTQHQDPLAQSQGKDVLE